MNKRDMKREAELAEQCYVNPSEFDYKKFAALVRADECEKCAKMVDHILKEGGGTYGDAIRARGKA
jgi:hypothetical protein